MMAAALLFVLKGLLAQPSARGVLSCAAQLVVSIFLLQTWIPSSRFWFCLNGVAWYLSVQAFLYAIFPPRLVVLKKADALRLRCIAVVIFCVQCLASFVFWKAGLSGKAAFYLTYKHRKQVTNTVCFHHSLFYSLNCFFISVSVHI